MSSSSRVPGVLSLRPPPSGTFMDRSSESHSHVKTADEALSSLQKVNYLMACDYVGVHAGEEPVCLELSARVIESVLQCVCVCVCVCAWILQLIVVNASPRQQKITTVTQHHHAAHSLSAGNSH